MENRSLIGKTQSDDEVGPIRGWPKFINKVTEELTAELFIKAVPIVILFAVLIAFELTPSGHGKRSADAASDNALPAWARVWHLEDGFIYWQDAVEQLEQGKVILDARDPNNILINNMPDGPLGIVLHGITTDEELTGRMKCLEHGAIVCPYTDIDLRLHNELRLVARTKDSKVVYDMLFVLEEHLGTSHTKLADASNANRLASIKDGLPTSKSRGPTSL